ncbi:MAG: OpgC domain-containing protein [Candidatus Binatia bacterium]
MPSLSTSSSGRLRDPLLDLWRGIALVDMAWVHLATYPIGMPEAAAAWIGQHTPFAAGCFVLLSGLTVRRVFGPGLESGAARQPTIIRLLRRALLLVVVGRLASMAFATIEWLLRSPPGGAGPDNLFAIATFGEAGATGGLLLLYSLLLTATPFLERMRLAIGGASTMLLSLAVFAAAQFVSDAAHWPPWTFPLAHWQPLFVAGYLASPHLGRLRDSSGAVSARWLVATTIGSAALFGLRSGPTLGLDLSPLPALVFLKVPLNGAELLWYAIASAFVLSWSARMYEGSALMRRSSAWLVHLGRWSLLVYVSHLLLELPIIAFLTLVDPSPLLRMTMLVVMAAGLNLAARLASAVAARRNSGAVLLPIPAVFRGLLPPAGAAGGAVALACALTVLQLRVPDAETFVAIDADVAAELLLMEVDTSELTETGEMMPALSFVEDGAGDSQDGWYEQFEEDDDGEESPAATLPDDDSGDEAL